MLTARSKIVATFFALVFALVVLFSPQAAAEPTFISNSAHNKQAPDGDLRELVLNDIADRSLDTFDLFTAALILGSDGDRDKVTQCRERLMNMQSRLVQMVPADASDARIAKLTLRFLHRKILTGEYEAGSCDPGLAINGGTHNCIMSTILFCVLGESLGLDVHPVALPEHVRCELFLDNGSTVAIETTSPQGYATTESDPGPADAHTDQRARRLSSVGLLAKVLYNRGLQSLASRNFESALAQTELSHRLDPDHLPAAGNIASVINNWALHRCNDGDFAGAIELLERGLLLEESKILQWNRNHIYSRWLQSVEQRNAPDSASQLVAIRAAMGNNLSPEHSE